MYARKTYSRTPDRKIVGGKIDVSREELADFKRKYGADKTLRDLLNYDRTGKLPGVKAAAGSGRGASAGRTAADRDMGPGRPGPKTPAGRIGETTIGSRAERAERSAMEAMDKQRADRAEQRRREDLMRPGRDAITPVMGPEMGLAGLGRAALGALGRGVTGMMTRRGESKEAQREAAEKARDEVRERMRIDDEPKPSVFRSNRPPKDDIPTLRDAIEYKKGGTAKAYAKGGSVRGSGCETRTKKTRYV
jgi:hypothetical protein